MSDVDDVKSRIDILDVVSKTVNLQRSGRSYKAACPFHTEKTPSFYVFPERQSWRCFGACATGGDVFSFVMRNENLDFGEALKSLAQQAGVNLTERKGQKEKDETLHRINQAAMEFFQNLLAAKQGARARQYVEERGLRQETVEKFQLGLSPSDGESLMGHLASNGYNKEDIALAGVVTRGRESGYRDLFRGRLMFPIRDWESRLAGFGGRALDDSNPKYLNTPRSPIFDKGHILYALHLAKEHVREKGVVIVEGYMDAIAAHQAGFANVVASMGTALTQQQVSLVRKTVGRTDSGEAGSVVLALDPDAAGQEATLNSLESSWEALQTVLTGTGGRTSFYQRASALSLKVARLPQGRDPDQIIREDPEEWTSLVDNATPFVDFLFEALSRRVDIKTPQGKAALAGRFNRFIAATPDAFQQDYYFQRLAELLEVSEETLRASLERPGARNASRADRRRGAQPRRTPQAGRAGAEGAEAVATPFVSVDHDPLEERCLALVLHDQSLVDGTSGGGLPAEHFRRSENREVFTNWLKCSTLDNLKETLDEELKGHLERLLAKPSPPSDRQQLEREFRYCARRLEGKYLRELNKEEEILLSQATPQEVDEHEQRLVMVNERLRDVFKE